MTLASMVTVLALMGCKDAVAEQSAVEQPPPGEVWMNADELKGAQLGEEKASIRELSNPILAAGRVAFDDLRVAHVYSPITGKIVEIKAELGSKVKKGDTLAVLDSPDLGVAQADLEKARADLVAAEHDIARQRELVALRAATAREVEQAEDAFARSRAEYNRSAKKLSLLRPSSGKGGESYVLRAPIDGAVMARSVSPGLEVQGQYNGGPASELFTIGDLSTVWVMADIFEVDVPRIKNGSRVKVTTSARPDLALEGVVDWLSTSLDPQSRTLKARCVIENLEGILRPEMFAQVEIDSEASKALAVPRDAIIHIGDQTFVFIRNGSRPRGGASYERRPVVADEKVRGDVVPIKRGLTDGETVVSRGAILLTGKL
jgi:cobalt-zinc-cadmium efflux system membrane fusion protein